MVVREGEFGFELEFTSAARSERSEWRPRHSASWCLTIRMVAGTAPAWRSTCLPHPFRRASTLCDQRTETDYRSPTAGPGLATLRPDIPPSTGSAIPVTKLARGSVRNTIAAATSSAVPNRRIG